MCIELKSFELFDFKLNLVKEIPATYIAGTLKQWLLAGKKGMDQVMLLSSSGKTTIYCRRFWLRDTLENQIDADRQSSFFNRCFPLSSGPIRGSVKNSLVSF